MMFLRQSLRRKLIGLITAIASVTVLTASAGLGLYQWRHARYVLFEEESATAQMTADSSGAAILFADKTAASETLAALHNDGRVLRACLYDKGDFLTGHYLSTSSAEKCPDLAPASGVFTIHTLSLVQPVVVKGTRIGSLYLDISLAELRLLTARLAETALIATLLATLFALIVSAVTERWVSGPILNLTRTAVEITQGGSRKLRAERTSDDEVGLLIDQFNAMLDKITERESELRLAYEQLELKVQERTQTLQDEIAERKLIELDLGHAKDLAEAASKAKSSFLANMSHELRTPLNAIIGYSEMLVEDAEDPAHEAMRSDLRKILSSARHLLNLISDILDLSKIEAGQMKVYLEEVPAGVLVNDVLPIAEALVTTNHNRLTVENRASYASVHVDALRFRQCLLNLLSNASKFTESGVLTLRTEIRDRDGRSWVVWSVQDTGIGIAPEDVSKLFRSFSQVDGSATRRHGGTGLGLCITQELCRAMNGWIEVDSELHVGSTFRIWLPLSAPEGTPT